MTTFSLILALLLIILGVASLTAALSPFPLFQRKYFRAFMAGLGISGITGGSILCVAFFLAPLSIPSASQTSYRFFSDRLVFSGTGAHNQPFLIELSFNRKESKSGGFQHYYFGKMVWNGTTRNVYKTAQSSSSEILPHLLSTNFERIPSADLSSRETYTFTLDILDTPYLFTTEPLEGDFLVKNEMHYTKYVNASRGTVKSSENSFSANVMAERIYSNDYRKSVFFKGYNELESIALQLIVWDESGNFYLIDESNVTEYNPSYVSHVWILHKTHDGLLRKSFKGSAAREGKPGAWKFNASLPEIGPSEIKVNLETSFEKNIPEGYVNGTITDRNGTRKISGEGYFHAYNQ